MKKSTKERVYDYMKEFGSITPLEAYRDLGTFSLREAIRDLKRDGFNIQSKFESGLNRWGVKTNFKRYWIGENE
jgi:hypothetical protein